MGYEIELKIELRDGEKQKLESYLQSDDNIIKYLGGYEQTDYYFDTIKPSFAEKDTALRVRVEKPLDSEDAEPTLELTYKGAKLNPTSKTRLEYNMNLVPSTTFETVENFFKELGFIKSVNIFKKRKNYLLDNNIVLSVDTNELGDFVEIEKISNNESEIASTEEELWKKLHTMIDTITKERKIVKSYLELILESRINKNR